MRYEALTTLVSIGLGIAAVPFVIFGGRFAKALFSTLASPDAPDLPLAISVAGVLGRCIAGLCIYRLFGYWIELTNPGTGDSVGLTMFFWLCLGAALSGLGRWLWVSLWR